MLSLLLHGLALFGVDVSSPAVSGYSSGVVTVAVKNGTLVGVHADGFNQDFFLGVPYAQPPTGNLRFHIPQPLNTSWPGTHSAEEYASECVGYGSDQWSYPVSEDCLYLNVIRPSGYDGQSLPVAFWIHGGGYSEGGSPDQRYNLSFMVQNSVMIGKPIIGVSINYRLSAWGFISSAEVIGAGQTNIGLRDQRLALHWVQENIEAFGGDPTKVTIWGESAGAASVGFHLTAYGGRDDQLFRGAIMESGNPIFYNEFDSTDYYQPRYNYLIQQSGCINSTDTLQCLRNVPYEILNAIINCTDSIVNGAQLAQGWNPTVDGDFIQKFTSLQLARGGFVHVPIISGANSDEGTLFSPQGVDNTEIFYNDMTNPGLGHVPDLLAQQLLLAYPDDPSVNVVQGLGDSRPGPPYGAQWRRSASYFGDAVFIANRRLTCQTWAQARIPAYCYRFNAIPAGIPPEIGVTHFQEVAFVFYNIKGVGYLPAVVPPFTNKSESYIRLSKFMNSNWISFVHDQDPNSWRDTPSSWNGSEAMWPRYSIENPQNIVFDANVSSHVEPDTFRLEGIQLINDNNAGVYHR